MSSTAEIETGEGGLPRVAVRTPYATAHVYLHGAHVTHYQPVGQAEVLFLSGQSFYRADKAIRGGVPICLPWFAAKADDPAAPAHGLARTKEWTYASNAVADDGSVQVTFTWASDDEVHRWFPHRFAATYTVAVGRELRLWLDVHNTGESAMTFTEALHTYLRVGDARAAVVAGLEATEYLDKTRGFQQLNQGVEPIRFTGETDRVYLNTRATCVLHDPAGGREISIVKDNSESTVVWNPWSEKAAALPDLADEEWQQFVCVETANTGGSAVTLAAGQSHAMSAVLRPVLR